LTDDNISFALLNMILPNFLPYMAHDTADQDIKRILIDRDITTLKQAFCRILCAEIQGNGTRVFVPDKLFSKNRLQAYLSGKELQLGRQLLESEDYNVYNRMIHLVIRELVSDGIITRQQEATADNPEEKYQATENLGRICKDFRDSGLSF
jgi:hypothetical protein